MAAGIRVNMIFQFQRIKKKNGIKIYQKTITKLVDDSDFSGGHGDGGSDDGNAQADTRCRRRGTCQTISLSSFKNLF